MKIKKSIVNLVLSKMYSNLKKVGRKVTNLINRMKSKTSSSEKNKLFNESRTAGEQFQEILITPENVGFYYDKCNGEGMIPLEDYMTSLKESIKEAVKDVKDKIVDEYNGKKLFITETIKNIYYKAKNLVVSISGSLIKINKEYREAIDKFLEIRVNITTNMNDILFENSIMEFIKANNIQSFDGINDYADILTKMYISEKDEKTYNILNRYNSIIQFNDVMSL